MTLWTVAYQISLSVGFSRQECWSGLPRPSPGDLPDPGIEPMSLMSSALACRFFTASGTWETLHCIYVPHFLYPFLCQWTFRLLSYLGCFKLCCSESCSAICPSGIIGSYGSSIFSCFFFFNKSPASGKESACQCRRHKRHRFNPWVRRIPWRRAWQPSILAWRTPWTEG